MGATQSTTRGGISTSYLTGSKWTTQHARGKALLQRPSGWTQRACRNKPPYAVDDRGFALTKIYKVPPSQLSLYPPTVYSLQQAREDIAACAAGRDLPHYSRVVRVDRVVKSRDPRVYALTKYHGYSQRDFADGHLLQLLPYTKKDAQIDISYFQRKGVPYYKVIKATSTVIDPKHGTVRNWRNKGFDDGYKYSLTDPWTANAKVRRLSDAEIRRKIDLSKYPIEMRAGRPVHMVPCSVLPVMCRKGNTGKFPVIADATTVSGASFRGGSKVSARGSSSGGGGGVVQYSHWANWPRIEKYLASQRVAPPGSSTSSSSTSTSAGTAASATAAASAAAAVVSQKKANSRSRRLQRRANRRSAAAASSTPAAAPATPRGSAKPSAARSNNSAYRTYRRNANMTYNWSENGLSGMHRYV